MTTKSLIESINPKGHLEIIKTYNDGTSETVLDDHNVITDGMGISLAALFAEDSSTRSVSDFTIGYIQLGTSSLLMTSSVDSLLVPLTLAEYGNSELTVADYLISTGSTEALISINSAYVTKPTLSKVSYTVLISDDACNGENLSEIGLFSVNPLGTPTPVSFLCAYRTFSPIAKTESFSLTFRWTLEF